MHRAAFKDGTETLIIQLRLRSSGNSKALTTDSQGNIYKSLYQSLKQHKVKRKIHYEQQKYLFQVKNVHE